MAYQEEKTEIVDKDMILEKKARKAASIFSSIKSELDEAGYALSLDENPQIPFLPELVTFLCQRYINYALFQENAASAIDGELPELRMQYSKSPEILDILSDYERLAKLRQENVETIKAAVEELSSVVTRESQDECFRTIILAQNCINDYIAAHEKLTLYFNAVNEKLRGGLATEFIKDPRAVIVLLGQADNDMLSSGAKEKLRKLTPHQLDYLSTSKYLSKCSNMLRNDVEGFIALVCDRVDQILRCSSKNGTFVEINACEKWFDKPIFLGGEICHPKIADAIIRSSESQIASLKAKSKEAGGDYVPYTKCDLSVYCPTTRDGLAGIRTQIGIGDGTQAGLKEHMFVVCVVSDDGIVKNEVYANLAAAMRELAFKDKIFTPPPRNDADNNTGRGSRNKSIEEYRDKIVSERAAAFAAYFSEHK